MTQLPTGKTRGHVEYLGLNTHKGRAIKTPKCKPGMNFLNQLEFSLSGNFNSNDVLGKVKMFDQIASMTEEAKQEAIKKRMDYERRRSVFEKRKISSSSSTMQSSSRGQN